jgi:acetyl esterase
MADPTTERPSIDPTMQALLDAFPFKFTADDGVEVAREQMRQLKAPPEALPEMRIEERTVDYGDITGIPVRIYWPPIAQHDNLPVVVFYHGGGWSIGDLDTHDTLCRLSCRDAGVHVLSIDYRLAPEHPAPAAIEDAYAAFTWASEHAGELGATPGQVAVGGDSAGANLAAVVSQLARDDDGPAPVLQWLLYPRTDFSARTRSLSLFSRGFLLTKRDIDWFESQYLRRSDLDRTDPRVSPALAESLAGLAPALIAVAGFDPLRDEGESYAEALRAAGTAVDLRYLGSLTHGFANLFQLGGDSMVATTELISALRAHLSRA